MWLALYKKELKGFFYGYSAYFILAIYWALSLLLAFFFGLYFVVDNPSMRSYFAFQPQVLVIIIPAITMRLWAEENKNSTLELLFSFPVSSVSLVSAKFAAAMTIVLLMFLLALPLTFSTIQIIEADTLNIVSSYCGTFLAALSLTALGCVVSIIIPQPLSAYLLSLLLGWGLVNLNLSLKFLTWLEYIPNTPFYLVEALSFSSRYQSFLNGQFTPDAVIYFICLTVELLFLNWIIVNFVRSRK